jgi:hypothetical protein
LGFKIDDNTGGILGKKQRWKYFDHLTSAKQTADGGYIWQVTVLQHI